MLIEPMLKANPGNRSNAKSDVEKTFIRYGKDDESR